MFDECLAVRATNDRTNTNFKGQYCTVYFRPTLAALKNDTNLQPRSSEMDRWLSFAELLSIKTAHTAPQATDSEYLDYILSQSSAFCLPSSCSATDLRQAMADMVGQFAISDDRSESAVSILTATDQRQCYVDSEAPQLDGADYAVL